MFRLFKSEKPDKTGCDIINLENESIEIKRVIERSGQVLKEIQWVQERAQTNWNLSECQIDQEQGSVSRKVSKFIQSLMAPEYSNTSEGTKYKKTDSVSSHLVKKASRVRVSHLEGGTEIPYYQNSKDNGNRQLTSTANFVTLSEDTLTSFINQSYGCPRRFPKPEMQVLYHYMMSGQLHMPLYVPHSQSHFSPSQNTRDMTCEENSVLAKELLKEEEEKEKKHVNEDKHEEDENEEEEENENEEEEKNENEEEDIDKRDDKMKERISNQLTIQILPSIDIEDKKTNLSSLSPSVEYLNSDDHITNGDKDIPIEDISQDVSNSVNPVVVLDGLPPSPMKQSDQHLHLPPYLQEGMKPHLQECTRMSSNEIEYKIQQHMEKQAHEWIQQELLARVMACVSEQQNSVSSSPSSYCSTSIDSKEDECHDKEIADDDIAELIKQVLFQQALGVLKSRKDEGKGEKGSSKEDYSFSFESNVSSESTPYIPTPHPTPPSSPLHCTITPTDSLSRDIPTPDHTPTYTSEEEEEDETLLKEEIFTPEQTSELMSESSTKLTTPTTTRIISNQYVTPKSQEEKLEDIQKCTQSLSESSTHSSSTPPTYTCLSTSTVSTDNDISVGQSVLLHRPFPLRIQETKSISEGEVPLSPGDARWKIHIPREGTSKRGGHDKDIKNVRNKITIKAHPRKESSDSSSDTSKNLMPSLGEVRKTNKKNVKFERTQEDSFDRFLTKLSTSTPDTDSSTTVKDNTIEDDTLADVPSMSDISFSSLHSGGRYPNLATNTANTVNTSGTKLPVQLPKVLCDEPQGKGEIQYHRDSLSPGEVRRSRYNEITGKSLVKGRGDNQDGGSSLSEGEVPKILQTRRERIVDCGAKGKTQYPKELEVESDMVQRRTGGILSENETRNGIDIIDISHHKDSTLSSKDSVTHREDEMTLGKDLPNTQSRQYTTENGIQKRRPDVTIVQEKRHPHIQPTGLIHLSPLHHKETSSVSGKAIQGKHLLVTDNVHQLRQTERHLSPMLSTSQDDLNPITAASITLQETITNEEVNKSTLNENGSLLHLQSGESVHDSSSEIYVKPKEPVVLINELVGNQQDDEHSFTFSSLSIPLTD